MVVTAGTLYEAVEPHLIWKQLLTSVIADITGDGTSVEVLVIIPGLDVVSEHHSQAIRMVMFILKTFSLQDEEIQLIHLPVVFSAIMDVLNVSKYISFAALSMQYCVLQLQVQGDISRASSPAAMEGLRLQEEILRHIPHATLMQRPELTENMQAASISQRPYTFACIFYDIKPILKVPSHKGPFDIPFASAFENMVQLSLSCAKRLVATSDGSPLLMQAFSQLLLLLDRLVGRLGSPISVSWKPAEWLSVVLKSLEHEVGFMFHL